MPLRPTKVLRFAFRLTIGCLLALTMLVAVLIAIYRVVPPVSTLMIGRWLLQREVTRDWVPLNSLSPNLVAAVIIGEDARFCHHNGVDWAALRNVLDEAGETGPSRGASTIAMQTAKNLVLWPSRSYIRKGLEIPIALALNLAWPKRRIIEIYLNIAEWGDGVFGAEAAARTYFGKSASALTRRESSLLAAALPNPSARDPRHPSPRQRALASINLERTRDAESWLDCLKP
jgi:monofunctional biosynthetic peptidoglycan transglycosylase